ncbi:MAG: hypothetical protein ACYC2T_01225 [Bacillota bacterium]
MNKYIYAVLIKSKNIEAIKKAVQGENIYGHIYPANKHWRMVVFKEHSTEKAKALSAMLNTSVIYFFDLTDNSWKYILYHKGKEKHALQADRLEGDERQLTVEELLKKPSGKGRTPKGERVELTPLYRVCKHYISRNGKGSHIIKGQHLDYLL